MPVHTSLLGSAPEGRKVKCMQALMLSMCGEHAMAESVYSYRASSRGDQT